MAAAPVLSVIVTTYNAGETIRPCLRSLAAQTAGSSLEVIVVDSSSDGTAGIVAAEFPWVRLIIFSQRKFCGDARNAGIAQARGRVIALTDADCTARENWAKEILKIHGEKKELAIGGAIGNAASENLVGWAAYFCEFSEWMPGSAAGFRGDIAGANMSYKREAFDIYGAFIEGTYCSDTEFHWRLEREGLFPRFEPSIQVFHHSISSLGKFLLHEFNHGRSFAEVRAAAQNFSAARRAAHALLFGFAAIKRFLQIAVRNTKNRIYLKHFCASIPLTFLGVITWCLGEAFGYIGYFNTSHPRSSYSS